jgi:hypothetical protein
MNEASSMLFERLNKYVYPIYHSDGHFEVWKDQSKIEMLYLIREKDEDKFDLFNGQKIPLADTLPADRILSFIENDMNIGSPIPGAVIESMGFEREIAPEQGVTINDVDEDIIRKAASKNGMDDVDSFLKRLKKKEGGTVKKKKNIDLAGLDDE